MHPGFVYFCLHPWHCHQSLTCCGILLRQPLGTLNSCSASTSVSHNLAYKRETQIKTLPDIKPLGDDYFHGNFMWDLNGIARVYFWLIHLKVGWGLVDPGRVGSRNALYTSHPFWPRGYSVHILLMMKSRSKFSFARTTQVSASSTSTIVSMLKASLAKFNIEEKNLLAPWNHGKSVNIKFIIVEYKIGLVFLASTRDFGDFP